MQLTKSMLFIHEYYNLWIGVAQWIFATITNNLSYSGFGFFRLVPRVSNYLSLVNTIATATTPLTILHACAFSNTHDFFFLRFLPGLSVLKLRLSNP